MQTSENSSMPDGSQVLRPMRSIWLALAWHYLRQVMPVVLMLLAFIILGPLAVLGMFYLDGISFEPGEFDPSRFYFNYLVAGFFFYGVSFFVGEEGIRHFSYPMPISTRSLCIFHNVIAIVTVVVLNSIVLSIYQWVYDVPWPIFGTNILFAVTIVFAQAIAWSLYDFSFFRLVVCAGAVSTYIWAILSRHYPEKIEGTPLYPTGFLTALDWLFAAFVFAGSVMVCYRMLARHRSGTTRFLNASTGVHHRLDEVLLDFFSPRLNRLTSGTEALSWSEWRRGKFYAIGGGFMLAWLPMMIAVMKAYDQFFNAMVVMSCCLSAISGIASGQFVSMSLWANKQGDMSTFYSTLPLSDKQMGRIVFLNVLKTTSLSWGIVQVVGLLIPGLCFYFNSAEGYFSSLRLVWQYDRFGGFAVLVTAGWSLLLAWSIAGVIASLSWTGRQPVLPAVFFSLTFVAVAVGVTVRYFLPEPIRETALICVGGFCGVAATAITVFFMLKARQRGYLTSQTLWIAAVLWLAEIGMIAWFTPYILPWIVVCSGVATLSLLPLASAPLALAWNRHR